MRWRFSQPHGQTTAQRISGRGLSRLRLRQSGFGDVSRRPEPPPFFAYAGRARRAQPKLLTQPRSSMPRRAPKNPPIPQSINPFLIRGHSRKNPRPQLAAPPAAVLFTFPSVYSVKISFPSVVCAGTILGGLWPTRLPAAACDRAETKSKVKKTALFSALSVSLQHLWKCSTE